MKPGIALAFALLLSACAAHPSADAHIPEFARRPYEPFSRSAAIAVALREWRLFGMRVNDGPAGISSGGLEEDEPTSEKAERVQGLWQRVGEYWWLGLDGGAPEQRWTGKHDAQGNEFPPEDDGRYAWSAAFVSYVMRIAGAGRAFPYSASHSDYIDAAAASHPHYALQAEDPAIYAPVPGDLICLGRAASRGMQFADLPAGEFPSHCDIVVGSDEGALSVIGGNVTDSVTMKHVPVTADGLLFGADGMPIDTRYHWFVALRVVYAAD